jgi:hypothetical protein
LLYFVQKVVGDSVFRAPLQTGHVRTILVLNLVTGFLLVLFMPRSTSYERYTKKDIVNRFKDFLLVLAVIILT